MIYLTDLLLAHYEKDDIVYFYTSPDSFGVSKKFDCYSSTFYPGIDPLKFLLEQRVFFKFG